MYTRAIFLTLFSIAILLRWTVDAKSADEWKSRVIYQILTDRFARTDGDNSPCSNVKDYCGGTFQGIIDRLDYIEGLGVNAIWISPIPEQTDKGFHGYWQKNISNINPHFGSSSDLKSLVSACHSRGIWVLLDVVGNHMGMQSYGDWYNFTYFYPFNQKEHYHPYCLITDFNNQHQVEVCRLANLPDLDQSNPFVRSTLKNWVSNTVSTYGFDGIRVDTSPEVPKEFWSEYTESAGVFSIGEVFNGNPKYVAGYQGPLSATLDYPMYYKLSNAFQHKQSMRNIHDGIAQNSVFQDVSVLGTFLDNHDNPRFLSNNGDSTTLKNALTYIILAEGIPIIYYGTEQGFHGGGDPNNREPLWPSNYNTGSDLYKFISNVTSFRTSLGSTLYESKQVQRYVDDQFHAFTRGEVFVGTSNIGSGHSLSRNITYHPYSDGTTLVNALNSSDRVTVNGGRFTVSIRNGMPVVYTPASTLHYHRASVNIL